MISSQYQYMLDLYPWMRANLKEFLIQNRKEINRKQLPFSRITNNSQMIKKEIVESRKRLCSKVIWPFLTYKIRDNHQ